jgi:hypothetical protein
MVQRNRWLFFVGSTVPVLALMACGEATSTPNTPSSTPTIAYQLATLDTGNNPNSATVITYQKLLTLLHNKTGDSEQTISDDTVKEQQLLQNKGKDATLIDLMNGVNTAVKSKSEHIHYAEALTALITLIESQK